MFALGRIGRAAAGVAARVIGVPGLAKLSAVCLAAGLYALPGGTGEAQAASCPGNKHALGVSRTVEIDTTKGPGFGMQQYRAFDFLKPGEVVLTFDDGPLPKHTGKVLKALKHHCTKATFFPVGKLSVTYPKLIRQMIAEGHTVGVHGWSHPNMPSKSFAAAIADIEKGASAVQLAAEGQAAPFFRFPYLADSRKLIGYLEKRNLSAFSTGVDSKDYKTGSVSTLIGKTMARLKRAKKGILLFHDIKSVTARGMPAFLKALKSNGFKVVHIRPSAALTTLAKYDQQIAKNNKKVAKKTKPKNQQKRRRRQLADAGGRAIQDVVRTVRGADAIRKLPTLKPETETPPAPAAEDDILQLAAQATTPLASAATLSVLDSHLTLRQEHYNRMLEQLARDRAYVQVKIAGLAISSSEYATAVQHYGRARTLLRTSSAGTLAKLNNSIRSAYAQLIRQAGDSNKAGDRLTDMVALGLKPAAEDYEAVISKARGQDAALIWLKRMQKAGFTPGALAHNTMIRLAPNFASANAWAGTAEAKGHKLSLPTYEAILARAKTLENAQTWFKAMRKAGHDPSDRAIASLVTNAESYVAGRRLLTELKRSGLKPSADVDEALETAFAISASWDVYYETATQSAGFKVE